jgi:DNA-binding phage protein
VKIVASLRELQPVTVEPVPPQEQAIWDATMAAHHALGYQRAFGAHQRYWIRGQVAGEQVILGGFLFAAAAKSIAVRDAWVGWTPLQQQRFRYRIVANSRFLILAGVKVPHLASHALALVMRRLRGDWLRRFGYEPVLVETFVAPPWRGTCYRAANWVYLGQTTGQGRQDRQYARTGVIRQIFVYPLLRDWRRALMAPISPPAQEQEPVPGKDRTRKTANANRPQELALQGGSAGMITAEQTLNEMTAERIRRRFAALAPFLDEKQRRLLAGAEAITYGVGGLEQVAALVGMAKETVRRGMQELQNPTVIEPERVRRRGGGRKPTTASDPDLRAHLEELVSPNTRGDPQSPLRWTCKSTRKLAAQLNEMKPGRAVSDHLVRDLLHEMGYSLQANRKTHEGSEHPDRDAQFQYINKMVQTYQERNQPVISVDTKKKELVGDFKNAGVEWQPKGQPEEVRVHDFVIPELGKISPYGVYDPTRNEAWVNVGTDHDTATFAVASIRGWWQSMGRTAYPEAKELLITADGGGSNSSRSRLWKTQLQELADETGLSVAVCHFPPGTSKWNKIEHRLFSHITQNWRGRPLESHEVIVNLIANTTTATGLKVRCQLDTNVYPTGVQVSKADLAEVQIEHSQFHGEWNYVIRPRHP